MATGWVKALQCRSNASDDVHHPHPPSVPPTTHKTPLLALNCRATSHALKDAIFHLPSTRKPKPTRTHKPNPLLLHPFSPSPSRPITTTTTTITELLPAHHYSRRVVELIFSSSWSLPSPCEIHMLFRLHHPPCTLRAFEDYRHAVRSRAGADTRCAADGNELMRFRAAPSSSCPETKATSSAGIRTFAGSGEAHRSAVDGGGRSRAMLLCRVIAGRIRSRSDYRNESVYVGKGVLVVFDPRAVLPCFLIIYKA